MLSSILRLRLQILLCQQQPQVGLFLLPRTLSTLLLVGVRDQGRRWGERRGRDGHLGIWGQQHLHSAEQQQSRNAWPQPWPAGISLVPKSHLLFGSGWSPTAGDLSFPVLLRHV